MLYFDPNETRLKNFKKIMTLILGLQPKLRLENKSGLGECFKIRTHPHTSGFPTLGDFGNLSLVES